MSTEPAIRYRMPPTSIGGMPSSATLMARYVVPQMMQMAAHAM